MNKNFKIFLWISLGVFIGMLFYRYFIEKGIKFGKQDEGEFISQPISYSIAKQSVESYMGDLKPIFLRNSNNDRLQGWSIDTTLIHNLQHKHGEREIAGYQFYLAKFEQEGLKNDYYSLVIGAYKINAQGEKELLLTNDPEHCADCLYEYINPCPNNCPERTNYYSKPWINKTDW